MREIRPIGEQQEGRKVRLMKCLKDLDIEMCYNLKVKLQHKKTGKDCYFQDIVRERLDDEAKRLFLREFEEKINAEDPGGIKSKDVADEYVEYLRDSWDRSFAEKVEEIKNRVDECFIKDLSIVLNIGQDAKIRLKSFCTFEVLRAESYVIINGNQEGQV